MGWRRAERQLSSAMRTERGKALRRTGRRATRGETFAIATPDVMPLGVLPAGKPRASQWPREHLGEAFASEAVNP